MGIARSVNLEGQNECLGLWIADTEGSRTWLSILTELKNRGLNNIHAGNQAAVLYVA